MLTVKNKEFLLSNKEDPYSLLEIRLLHNKRHPFAAKYPLAESDIQKVAICEVLDVGFRNKIRIMG